MKRPNRDRKEPPRRRRVHQMTVFIVPGAQRFRYNINSQRLPQGSQTVCVMDRYGAIDFASGWELDARLPGTASKETLRKFTNEAANWIRQHLDNKFGQAPWGE